MVWWVSCSWTSEKIFYLHVLENHSKYFYDILARRWAIVALWATCFQTWSESKLLVFSRRGSFVSHYRLFLDAECLTRVYLSQESAPSICGPWTEVPAPRYRTCHRGWRGTTFIVTPRSLKVILEPQGQDHFHHAQIWSGQSPTHWIQVLHRKYCSWHKVILIRVHCEKIGVPVQVRQNLAPRLLNIFRSQLHWEIYAAHKC